MIQTYLLLYFGDSSVIPPNLYEEFISLLGSFAIIKASEKQADILRYHPSVLYLTLSKPIYPAIHPFFHSNSYERSKEPSTAAANLSSTLTGKGVAIAIIDSGVDFRHPDFCTMDGMTRILSYWDQTSTYDKKNSYGFGYIFSETDLNSCLNNSAILCPSNDFSSHGTHVAGICCGNGRNSGGKIKGVAPDSSLVVVKLKNESNRLFTDYANLMMAISYVVSFAAEHSIPLVINLSYGTNDGAHNCNSLLERFLTYCTYYAKCTICIATGNEGISRRHTSFFPKKQSPEVIDFSIASGERAFFLSLWSSPALAFQYTLFSPGKNYLHTGTISTLVVNLSKESTTTFSLGSTTITLTIKPPGPFQNLTEAFFAFTPTSETDDITEGLWSLSLIPSRSSQTKVNLWMPSAEATSSSTGFTRPDTECTLTIPSTANGVISVSGYDNTADYFAAFSGRGFFAEDKTRPSLCAPAVNILSTAPGGGYSIKTGTSMAVPFVSGTAALLMQYGIVSGMDPELFGDKVMAYLQASAQPLPAYEQYPNEDIGWGTLNQHL